MFTLIGVFVIMRSVFIFFFFKQKTAYEMRISDWSSDVCSSDLGGRRVVAQRRASVRLRRGGDGQGRASVPAGAACGACGTQRRTGRGISARFAAAGPLRPGRVLIDRKSVVEGKSVSVRVDLGGRRIIQKKQEITVKD